MEGVLRRLPRSAFRLVGGVAIMLALTFAGSAYGAVTAGGRIDPEVRQASANQPYVDVVVRVGFKPQAFHLRQMQDRGIVGAVTDSSITVRRVSRSELEVLAQTPWIGRVQLLQ